MGPAWVFILTVLVLAGVCAYLALRQIHVRRLRARAITSTSLPPAQVLSWSVPQSPPTVEAVKPVTTSPDIDTPALPDPPQSVSQTIGGFEGDRRAGLAAASIDGLLASLPSFHDLACIDWNVVKGIKLSAASGLDLDRWSNLRGYVDSHYFDVGEPKGFLNRLVGYVGEAKAGDYYGSQGTEVSYNKAPNVPGYDLKVDGDPIQVKVGGTAKTFRTHFERYPDTPVVTGPDNLEIVPDGADVSFVDSLDADQIHAATEESLDFVHDDFSTGGPIVPYITVIRSSLQQIGLLAGGHTDLTAAAKNVGLDAAGVGLGGWAGAQAGAAVGSYVGPYGTVIGGFIGAIAGVIGGKSIANEVKSADFRRSVEDYEKVVTSAKEAVQSKQVEAHRLLVAELARQQDGLQRYVHAVQRKLKVKLEGCHHWHHNRCIAFVGVFPKVLGRVRKGLEAREKAELAGMERSGLFRRALWPQLVDVRYGLLKTSFRLRIHAVTSAKRRFTALSSKTPSQIPASDAIRQIQQFVQGNPFESADFDNVCHQLRQVTDSAHKQEQRLKQQADALAQAEYGRRLAAMRSQFQDVTCEISAFVGNQAKTVGKAKDRVYREARKLGIDLKVQPEA